MGIALSLMSPCARRHNLGLGHDGYTGVNNEFASGSSSYLGALHGSGGTEWGPIMGGGWSADVHQWSNGDCESIVPLCSAVPG